MTLLSDQIICLLISLETRSSEMNESYSIMVGLDCLHLKHFRWIWSFHFIGSQLSFLQPKNFHFEPIIERLNNHIFIGTKYRIPPKHIWFNCKRRKGQTMSGKCHSWGWGQGGGLAYYVKVINFTFLWTDPFNLQILKWYFDLLFKKISCIFK